MEKHVVRPLTILYGIIEELYIEDMFNRARYTQSSGICGIIGEARQSRKITKEEWKVLYYHLQANRPTQNLHPEFYVYDRGLSLYWWDNNDKDNSNIQRSNFLEKMKTITINHEYGID